MRPTSAKKRLPALLVEPSTYFAHLMKTWLSEIGFAEVHVCATLRAARTILSEHRLGIIICELKLEESNGFALARETRHGASSLNRLTPIIALNARATSGHVELARDLGVTEFACKPLSRKAFVDRVYATLYNPRNFIKAGEFFGPDRRRRSGGFDGHDRRRQKPRRVLISEEFGGLES